MSADWVWQEDTDNISIHLKSDKVTGLNIVRGEGTVNATALEVKNLLLKDSKSLVALD